MRDEREGFRRFSTDELRRELYLIDVRYRDAVVHHAPGDPDELERRAKALEAELERRGVQP